MNQKKQHYNLSKSKFLASYDLINKYKLKNFFSIPRIQNLSLNVSSNNLKSLLNENQSFLNKFFFLVFFLFTSNKTFLKSENSIKSKTNLLKENENFLIQNTISNKILLSNFQRDFFNENSVISFLRKNINTFDFSLREETLKIQFDVPFAMLHDFNYLLDNMPRKSALKEGDLCFTFTFTNIDKKNFPQNSIKGFFKNLPFFWFI